MPEQPPKDWGIPIWEAIERWTPRELWENYREVADFDIPIVMIPEIDPRYDEVERLHSQISEILVDRLVRGELIASAIALPLKETSRRRDIRPDLWSFLGFGSEFSGVVGGGLIYGQVLIREPRPAVPGEAERTQEAVRSQVQRVHALPARSGRPSVMPGIEEEMRRRAKHGQIAPTLRREAEGLAAWAAQEFPAGHVPKPKSIEKRLGQIYRQLNPTKRPDK